ncbi:MAG: fructose-bisphosphate aldolase class I [Bacteroidetes bacterium]|nr:fructose-bisphosphate aldolase class I [Bacteroidota bacterium]
MNELMKTAQSLVADDKGLLAMDESTPTCNKRFAALGIPQTVEARRSYRQLLITTPRLGESISGVILYDETIRQQTDAGVSFVDALNQAGIIPGIKVDLGAKPLAGFPGERITDGLDGLRERLIEYKRLGARFAKWRAVIAIGAVGSEQIPSGGCLEANMHALARYAALCQEAGLVPIVEPEVLMEGTHDLDRSFAVTQQGLIMLFTQLYTQRVRLEGLLLKPNMVLAGKASSEQSTTERVADATVTCLLRSVPPAVAGIAFLSGGQSPEQATSHLNAMHERFADKLPWPLTFSFARAIQQPALNLWKGQDSNVEAAQQALFYRASSNRAARKGQYRAEHT